MLAITASALMVVGSIAVSLIVFAFTLTILLVAGLYLWWKTRHLREYLRTRPPHGVVIEGEVIRENVNSSSD